MREPTDKYILYFFDFVHFFLCVLPFFNWRDRFTIFFLSVSLFFFFFSFYSMLIVLVTFNIVLVHFFVEERLNITGYQLDLLFTVY